jgi:hypothetical protein
MQYRRWAAQCAYADDGGTRKERIVAWSPNCWGRHMDRLNWLQWTQIVHKVIISIATYYTRHTEGCEPMVITESEGRSCCTSPAPVLTTWNQDLGSDARFWWNSSSRLELVEDTLSRKTLLLQFLDACLPHMSGKKLTATSLSMTVLLHGWACTTQEIGCIPGHIYDYRHQEE